MVGPRRPAIGGTGFEAEYIDPKSSIQARRSRPFKARFGISEDLITTYHHPYVYLNRAVIADKGIDQAAVELAVAEALTRFDGVALAVSSRALRSGRVANTPLIRSIARNDYPGRSGDVYVVFDPNRFINDFDGLTVAATHGSPWRYDTYVPIYFAGMGIPAQRINRLVPTVDIAPTLSHLVGVKPPSGSFGSPLLEIMRR